MHVWQHARNTRTHVCLLCALLDFSSVSDIFVPFPKSKYSSGVFAARALHRLLVFLRCFRSLSRRIKLHRKCTCCFKALKTRKTRIPITDS